MLLIYRTPLVWESAWRGNLSGSSLIPAADWQRLLLPAIVPVGTNVTPGDWELVQNSSGELQSPYETTP
ncbi:hypothetical protein NG791_24835 [Laspinema sp. D1]|nr:hypothetical protein [Laspinema sp. D2b]